MTRVSSSGEPRRYLAYGAVGAASVMSTVARLAVYADVSSSTVKVRARGARHTCARGGGGAHSQAVVEPPNPDAPRIIANASRR